MCPTPQVEKRKKVCAKNIPSFQGQYLPHKRTYNRNRHTPTLTMSDLHTNTRSNRTSLQNQHGLPLTPHLDGVYPNNCHRHNILAFEKQTAHR